MRSPRTSLFLGGGGGGGGGGSFYAYNILLLFVLCYITMVPQGGHFQELSTVVDTPHPMAVQAQLDSVPPTAPSSSPAAVVAAPPAAAFPVNPVKEVAASKSPAKVAAPPAPPAAAAAVAAVPPSSQVSATSHPVGSSRREAALLYFGTVGADDYYQKEEMIQGKRPWNMRAAAGSRPYIDKHVIEFNKAKGWTMDTFFHTWNAPFEAELVELLHPVARSVGEQELRGEVHKRGMAASIDIALQLLKKHVESARGGREYDRILVVRFDSIFYTGFDLDALVEADALYVASWCKADSAKRVPDKEVPKGALECFALRPYWADLEGTPDFWFAGGQGAVLKTFEHLEVDMASGAVVKGRTCSGCGHAQIWGALNGHKVKTRRYGYHQIDNDLFRDKVCGVKWENFTLKGGHGSDWFKPDQLNSNTPDSICKGMWCVVNPIEDKACATGRPDADDREKHGPAPPYPLGGPRTGETP